MFSARAEAEIRRKAIRWPHTRFWIWVAVILFLYIFAPAIGGYIETRAPIFQVLQDQSASDAENVNGKMCWNWSYTKRRAAMLIGAYAQLYVGNSSYPLSVGLEHEDGTPIGMGPDADPQNVRTCVPVPVWAWSRPRMGVRPKLVYQDSPYWAAEQDGAWVDWYQQPK